MIVAEIRAILHARHIYQADTHLSSADLLRLSGRPSYSALDSVNRGRLPTRRLKVTSTRSSKSWNSKNWPMPSLEFRVRVCRSNRGERRGLSECCWTRWIADRYRDDRKRTTIGVELVAKPKLLFLDEPTSGLGALALVALTFRRGYD